MDHGTLKNRQSLNIAEKIYLSQQQIHEWYEAWDGNVYVSFSGGKDSTVLLHLVRSIYPEVPAVFVDTGLEYPEIRSFVKTFDNVVWIKPEMTFQKIIEKYGFPVISKSTAQKIKEVKRTKKDSALYKLRITGIRKNGEFSPMSKISNKWRYLINSPFMISDQCCKIIKKMPFEKYNNETEKSPFIGVRANDSMQRRTTCINSGCNSFNGKSPKSLPLSFWMEEDIWDFLHKFNIPYSKIYDMGESRTGCMFCMFGVHLEKRPNRFQRMKKTHQKHYDYCINKLGCGKVLDYIGVEY